MVKRVKNLPPPPQNADFWTLFDYFWDSGVGRELSCDGVPVAWTADALEEALDFKISARTIDNWHARKNLPSVPYIHTLCTLLPAKELILRTQWSDAFIKERRAEDLRLKQQAETAAKADVADQAVAGAAPEKRSVLKLTSIGLVEMAVIALVIVAGLWWSFSSLNQPEVANIRICEAPHFDETINKCVQHVDVFMDQTSEVFLSFDLVNVPDGMAFERWWIKDGERVAGRSSFNDAAWPGWTFWRPQGGLRSGQYVVRLIVDGRVFTQVFSVQPEWFGTDNAGEPS